MKKSMLFRTAVGTIAILGMVACAQKEFNESLTAGMYVPLTEQEVLRQGFDASGNVGIMKSNQYPGLQMVVNAKSGIDVEVTKDDGTTESVFVPTEVIRHGASLLSIHKGMKDLSIDTTTLPKAEIIAQHSTDYPTAAKNVPSVVDVSNIGSINSLEALNTSSFQKAKINDEGLYVVSENTAKNLKTAKDGKLEEEEVVSKQTGDSKISIDLVNAKIISVNFYKVENINGVERVELQDHKYMRKIDSKELAAIRAAQKSATEKINAAAQIKIAAAKAELNAEQAADLKRCTEKNSANPSTEDQGDTTEPKPDADQVALEKCAAEQNKEEKNGEGQQGDTDTPNPDTANQTGVTTDQGNDSDVDSDVSEDDQDNETDV